MLLLCSKDPSTNTYHRKKIINFDDDVVSIIAIDLEETESSAEKRKSGGIFSSKSDSTREPIIELKVERQEEDKRVETSYKYVYQNNEQVD